MLYVDLASGTNVELPDDIWELGKMVNAEGIRMQLIRTNGWLINLRKDDKFVPVEWNGVFNSIRHNRSAMSLEEVSLLIRENF